MFTLESTSGSATLAKGRRDFNQAREAALVPR